MQHTHMFCLCPPIKIRIRKTLIVLDLLFLGLCLFPRGDGQFIQFREDKRSTLCELNVASAGRSLHCPFDLCTCAFRGGHAIGNGRSNVYGNVERGRVRLPSHHEAVEAVRSEELVVDAVEECVLPSCETPSTPERRTCLLVWTRYHTAFDSEYLWQSSR